MGAENGQVAAAAPPPDGGGGDAATEPTAEALARAEELKGEANQAFKDKRYAAAVELYTAALALHPRSAVLLSNRAFAHLRLEALGAAAADAGAALAIDPGYAKAYYRRGDAAFALGHFGAAARDFRAAARLAPRDPDLRRKLAEAEREHKRARFEAALAGPAEAWVSDTFSLDDIDVPDSYTGPRMERAEEEGEGGGEGGGGKRTGAGGPRYRLTRAFVDAMVDEFRAQRMVHRRFALQVVLDAQHRFRAAPSLVRLPVPAGSHLTVCGDTHGQFYDLLRIFELAGPPSGANPYLFNGDFVDRGSFSVEVILTLLAHAALDPASMHLTRGNHESRSMNAIYGFFGEVRAKLGASAVELFRETFCWLPLGYVLDDKVLVVHGGIPSWPGATLADIEAADRAREPPDEGAMCEVLWNDPAPEPGCAPSKRGVGVAFGPDVTRAFLERNGLALLVRSHEVKDDGYEVAHDGYCVTIFSAPNYCDQVGNRGAFIRFEGGDMAPRFTQFDAAPHPDVRAMAYAGAMMGGMMGF